VRRAPGAPHDGEALQAEIVGDRPYVLRHIGDAAAREPVRTAVPGTVVGDQLCAALIEHHAARRGAEPAARRTVQQEDRSAARIAETLHHQMPPVRRAHPTSHPNAPLRRTCPVRYMPVPSMPVADIMSFPVRPVITHQAADCRGHSRPFLDPVKRL
jgi:hypothetical protein